MVEQIRQHFLVVVLPLQSHINPALQLARRLTGAGAHVTFSTTISGHRLMFQKNPEFPLNDPNDPLLTYSPFSDGRDEGYDWTTKGRNYASTLKVVGYETLQPIASAAATPEKPAVTCMVYTLLLPWVAKLAHDLGLPSTMFWIQAAADFSIYYHYFHDYKFLIDSHCDHPSFEFNLPCLPPIKIKDLPSFIVNQSKDNDFGYIIEAFEEIYQLLDDERPHILVNSFESLEPEVIGCFTTKTPKLDLITIGPLLPETMKEKKKVFVEDIIKNVDNDASTKSYMEWLDRWPAKSVVYVSFGSISLLGKKKKEEFSTALAGSERPYLWVVRGDKEGVEVEEDGKGMVVGWCSQVDVLSHASVGCFVTHCGWNSTLESLACSVPMITFPQWSNQPTNAWVVEALWGTGVRMEVNGEGMVEEWELKRCLDFVMGGENESGSEIRTKAETLKEKARKAMVSDCSSRRNLEYFLNDMIRFTD